jgi:hypothetical protein
MYSTIGGLYHVLFVLLNFYIEINKFGFKNSILYILINCIVFLCYLCLLVFSGALFINHLKIVKFNTSTINGLDIHNMNKSDFGVITNLIIIFDSFLGIFLPIKLL